MGPTAALAARALRRDAGTGDVSRLAPARTRPPVDAPASLLETLRVLRSPLARIASDHLPLVARSRWATAAPMPMASADDSAGSSGSNVRFRTDRKRILP